MGVPGPRRPPRHAQLSLSKGGARSLYYAQHTFIPPVPRQTPAAGASVTAQARRAGPPRPRKSLGQHFLCDSRIAARIVDAAALTPADTVVEIGPGRGVLTRRLTQQAGQVVAVELDARLCDELPARLGFPANLQCITADARQVDLPALVSAAPGYNVIGNLPYYAANPIIRRTLESVPPPSLALFMVQREVADTMTAAPGAMSMLSVATQYYAEARLICAVPPSAFRPPPKVRSAVVRLALRERPAVETSDREAFFALVRAGFSAPRKQLRNSLSHGLGLPPADGAAVLERASIDGRRRPATLSLQEWAAVCAAWQETGTAQEMNRSAAQPV